MRKIGLKATNLCAWISAAALGALAACAGEGPAPLPPPPVHANGQALWTILHGQCVPDQQAHGQPAPCVLVDLAGGEARGFVVLKDREGVAQHLLMPTAKITGMEDPALLAPDAVNYFARAWDERHFVGDALGHPLERTQLSIAVNSRYGRSQDQLHLHIDCVDRTVAAALATTILAHDGRWVPVRLKGRAYRVRWMDEDTLARTDPFKLLARSQPGARQAMGAWTLALIGAAGPGDPPGFYLLADRANPAAGDPASAEDLQDHKCRL